MTILTKSIEQYMYVPVAMFIVLCKVVLIFECVNEILKCDCILKYLFGGP